MEAALERFEIDVTGMTCLDAGLSTGGFTDCLLQKGAIKVYGVDVGFGQVTTKLIARLVRMFTGVHKAVSCSASWYLSSCQSCTGSLLVMNNVALINSDDCDPAVAMLLLT